MTAPVLPAPGDGGSFRAGPVAVAAERLLRIQGYSDPHRVRARIREAAEYAAGLAGEIADGRVGFRRVAVTRLAGDELELDARHTFHCAAFERFLAGCDSVVAFVLTAGAAFDARIDEMMHGDRPVEGLFLDSAGWLVVEAVTRRFAEALKVDCAKQGLRLTRRLGPGYSYRLAAGMASWDLAEQRGLFAALGGVPLPSRLMDSAAMQPKMSRSGLYGLRGEAPRGAS